VFNPKQEQNGSTKYPQYSKNIWSKGWAVPKLLEADIQLSSN
jgi:hypothetical protein